MCMQQCKLVSNITYNILSPDYVFIQRLSVHAMGKGETI